MNQIPDEKPKNQKPKNDLKQKRDASSGLSARQRIYVSLFSALILVMIGWTLAQIFQSDDSSPPAQIELARDTVEPARDSEQTVTGENLLPNGSFEQDPFRAGDWTVDERRTDLVTEWTGEHAHSGDYSIKLTASQGANNGWPGWFIDVPIEDGYTYVFSAYALTLDGASGWLDIRLYSDDDPFIMGYSTGCIRPQEGWHQRSFKLQPGDYREEGATHMRLGLLQCMNFSEGAEATMYIDDVALYATIED